MKSLAENVKITQVLGNQTAATSSKGSSVVDMQGYDGVLFVASLSVGHSSTNFIKAQQGPSTTTSGFADLLGSKVLCTAGQLQAWLDIYRPRERYVRCVVARGASSVIYPMWAYQYNLRKPFETNVTAGTINGEVHVSPAEGTA